MQPSKLQLPRHGDLVYLRNGQGGFVGAVAGTDKLKTVPISEALGQFILQAIDAKRIALRHQVSGKYLGGSSKAGESPFLVGSCQQCEYLTTNVLPNGMVMLINHNNCRLSKDDGDKLVWSNNNRLSESWNFDIIQKYKSGVDFDNVKINGPLLLTEKEAMLTNLIPPSGSELAIQSRIGGFIGVVRGKGDKICIANTKQDWQKFIIESKGNGKWAFKQRVSGLYLGGVFADNGNQISLTDCCQGCEKFELIPKEEGWLVIKSDTGTYLKKEGNKVIWQQNCLAYEYWKLVPDVGIQSFGGFPGTQMACQENWANDAGQQAAWHQGQPQTTNQEGKDGHNHNPQQGSIKRTQSLTIAQYEPS